MGKEKAKILLRDIEIFSDEFQISPETVTNRMGYPRLIERLREGKHVKPVTIERVYTEMELQRFKMEVKECNSLRQAISVALKFLKGRAVDLT